MLHIIKILLGNNCCTVLIGKTFQIEKCTEDAMSLINCFFKCRKQVPAKRIKTRRHLLTSSEIKVI